MPGSTDGLKSVWPMPRMYATSALPNEEFAGRNETLGAFAVIWNRFVWLRASSISAVDRRDRDRRVLHARRAELRGHDDLFETTGRAARLLLSECGSSQDRCRQR